MKIRTEELLWFGYTCISIGLAAAALLICIDDPKLVPDWFMGVVFGSVVVVVLWRGSLLWRNGE